MDLTGEAGCGFSSCSSISSAASYVGYVTVCFIVFRCFLLFAEKVSERSGAWQFGKQAPDGRLVQLGLSVTALQTSACPHPCEAVGDVEKCLACVEGVFQGVQDTACSRGERRAPCCQLPKQAEDGFHGYGRARRGRDVLKK